MKCIIQLESSSINAIQYIMYVMGTLYIVSTPIGNLEDITLRAMKTLFSVDIITCEDTRKTGNLLSELRKRYTEAFPSYINSTKKSLLLSFYDEVEENKIPKILEYLMQDKSVALVSDAGTPLIADPGFKLVRECLKRNIKVTTIPGPTSVISALIMSGLPANQFLYLGYLPETRNTRHNIFEKLILVQNVLSRQIHPTIVFFESPHGIKKSLEDLQSVLGDIEIVIAREMTKIHEEIWRGKISDYTIPSRTYRGEFVILFTLYHR